MYKELWIAQSYDWETRQVLGVFSTKAAAEARADQYLKNCDGTAGDECVEVTPMLLDAVTLTSEEEDVLLENMRRTKMKK